MNRLTAKVPQYPGSLVTLLVHGAGKEGLCAQLVREHVEGCGCLCSQGREALGPVGLFGSSITVWRWWLMRCLLSRRLGLLLLLLLLLMVVSSGIRSSVIELRMRLGNGLLVRMQSQAVVAWWRSWRRRWVVVALRACGIFAVCHDDDVRVR